MKAYDIILTKNQEDNINFKVIFYKLFDNNERMNELDFMKNLQETLINVHKDLDTLNKSMLDNEIEFTSENDLIVVKDPTKDIIIELKGIINNDDNILDKLSKVKNAIFLNDIYIRVINYIR